MTDNRTLRFKESPSTKMHCAHVCFCFHPGMLFLHVKVTAVLARFPAREKRAMEDIQSGGLSILDDVDVERDEDRPQPSAGGNWYGSPLRTDGPNNSVLPSSHGSGQADNENSTALNRVVCSIYLRVLVGVASLYNYIYLLYRLVAARPRAARNLENTEDVLAAMKACDAMQLANVVPRKPARTTRSPAHKRGPYLQVPLSAIEWLSSERTKRSR